MKNPIIIAVLILSATAIIVTLIIKGPMYSCMSNSIDPDDKRGNDILCLHGWKN